MNWNESLQRNLTTAEELRDLLHLNEEETERYRLLLERFPMSVTRYYLSLIDWDNKNDPIRRMCIPSIHETELGGSFDTSGESDNTVIEGLQHKYGQTALLLSTNRCAMYCRHCFRKRLVGLSGEEITSRYFDDIIEYIDRHREITNVLISGGDAFLNSNKILSRCLERLTGIDHLDFIRFGTRTPVTFPERITGDPELVGLLREAVSKKQLYVITHFNHPREITADAAQAVRLLLNSGIPVRNQTVLLNGVNDNPQILGLLLSNLTAIGVLPYYIFQCRPVTGVKSHFQVPLIRGCEIVEQAKHMQNGLGKNIRYVMSHETGKIEMLGRLEGDTMLFKYHQAKYRKDAGRIFTRQLDPVQSWL